MAGKAQAFKRGGRSGGHPKQSGGGNKLAWNAKGSAALANATKTTDAFKKGGKVMGCKSKARMDKYARGGRAGSSPFSSAKIKENTSA